MEFWTQRSHVTISQPYDSKWTDTVTIISSVTKNQTVKSLFGNSGSPLSHDDLEALLNEQVKYWLSDRSPHKLSAITRNTFSDPRIEAIQCQIREAETVQAIARLRLVRADYQKRIFLLSNLPVEMPVDHLIGFNNLMPDKLEMELIKQGNVPLTRKGLLAMRPDLELSDEAAKKVVQRSKASNPKSLLSSLPVLIRTSAIIATFKSGNKRKTTHSHLFLPKNYSGDSYTSVLNHHTEAEVLAFLETGWGIGNISDLQLSFLYGAEDKH